VTTTVKKVLRINKCKHFFWTKLKTLFNRYKVKEEIIMAIDPICKMDVDEKGAKWVSEHKGKKYYFCAPGCKKEFEEHPGKYTE
jgi:YHS domain-containing protein